jgi:hypothetical protein
MRLNRFRLRPWIYLGFGFLVALLLGITAFGSYASSSVGQEIGTMTALQGNVWRCWKSSFAWK